MLCYIYRVAVIWKVKGGTNILIQSVPGESAGAYVPLEVTSVSTGGNHAPKFHITTLYITINITQFKKVYRILIAAPHPPPNKIIWKLFNYIFYIWRYR